MQPSWQSVLCTRLSVRHYTMVGAVRLAYDAPGLSVWSMSTRHLRFSVRCKLCSSDTRRFHCWQKGCFPLYLQYRHILRTLSLHLEILYAMLQFRQLVFSALVVNGASLERTWMTSQSVSEPGENPRRGAQRSVKLPLVEELGSTEERRAVGIGWCGYSDHLQPLQYQ